MDPRSPLRRRLHVWTTADLRGAGISRHRQQRLVADGALRGYGGGWFGTAETPDDVAGALFRGNRLTCLSAARILGLWTPDLGPDVHETSRRPTRREHDGVVSRHRPVIRRWPDDEPVLPLDAALSHALTCLDADSAAVLLESALERRLLVPSQVDLLLAEAPARRRRAIGRVSALAGSGSETRVRRYLERRGVRVREQVAVFEGGRVDLLVGDRLVIECDSVRHHGERSRYYADRSRDRASLIEGCLVLRLTWEDIWLRWEETRGALDTLIRRRVHRGQRIGGAGLQEGDSHGTPRR